MEIRARNKSIKIDSAYLKRGEKLEQNFTEQLEKKDFQSIKANVKDEKDKVYLMGIKSLEDLQRRNQSERSIIQSVKDRNDYARGQNIAKGVEVVSMGLAIVMLLFIPTPVGIGIMSVVGAYAVGKLMEAIAKNGLSLPYLGCFKPPALVASGMIFVARLCQFPVRYFIVKPYQYVVKFILLKKGEDNKVVDEKVAQQAKIEGNESANTLKDSVSALQFNRTGSPGNALFGGTVILADFIDSVYNLIQYFTDRSNKKVLNDLGVKVIHQGQQCTERGIFSSGGEDYSMTNMSRVLQREVRGLDEQKFRSEAKRVVNSQKPEKPNSLKVSTDKLKGYEKITEATRSKGKCPMTGANDCRCPPGHDVAENSAKTKTRAKKLVPPPVRSPQVRKSSLPRRGQ